MPLAKPAAPLGHLADRLFVAACTAVYVGLIACVLVALRLYGGR